MPEQRFIIAVQGEGRGHLTQAIAIIHLLQEQGHEVCGVIAGTNPHKPLPEFFLKAISAPLLQVESPHFTMNRKGSAIHMPATILHNLRRAGTYLNSLRKMRRFIEGHQPDIVINLYEPLVALYTLSYFRNFEIIAIAPIHLPARGFSFSERIRDAGRLPEILHKVHRYRCKEDHGIIDVCTAQSSG